MFTSFARNQGLELPADTVEGMREKVFKDEYADLNEYLLGFRYTTAVMQVGDNGFAAPPFH